MKVVLPKLIVVILIIWLIIVYGFFAFFVIGSGKVEMRAMLGMVGGLIILWVAIGSMHPVHIHFPPYSNFISSACPKAFYCSISN